jgi:hypothetical protein
VLLVRRWAFISALLLISIIALIYMGVVRYAQSIRIPYDRISVSEEVDLIMGRLSLWNACFFGLLMLSAAALCWRAVLHRAPEQEANRHGTIKASLVLIPLVSCTLYMLTSFALIVNVWQPSHIQTGDVPTPSPVRTR